MKFRHESSHKMGEIDQRVWPLDVVDFDEALEAKERCDDVEPVPASKLRLDSSPCQRRSP